MNSFFKVESHYAAQAGFKFVMILLPEYLKG